MKNTNRFVAASVLALALPNLALVQSLAAENHTETAQTQPTAPVWPFEVSDLPLDPGFTFGQLPNGMRYILRQNGTPEGTAMVRMRIDSGSLEETEAERGLSHYLEHMAFNGSTGIPEGEMIKLLEREGLAFGADTNASTGYEAITYMLNLPRNDEDLLDTALMIMRETASELTIAEDAVERERGVILAEERDRRNFQLRAYEDRINFSAPGARFIDRLPIGTIDVISNATAAQLRALYERTYTPANTVLVIVGDYPVDVMEAKLKERFADWSGPAAPVDPETGPIDITRTGLTDIYTDPSLSENLSVFRLGPWIDEPDTLANRRNNVLRSIGYAIVNRRLARLARGADAPFRGASYGAGEVFEDARTVGLNVSSVDGEWRKGLLATVQVVNEALTYGFTQAEVDEQIARRRTALENAVKAADTRANAAFTNSALSLVVNELVPTTPQSSLERFEGQASEITPESVFAAFKADTLPLTEPMIRFQGRTAPEGAEQALRAAFAEAMALPISAPEETGALEFAYTDFGEPGAVVADDTDGPLGIRRITFANGVRLNLKQTDIREDRISVRVAVDGGNLLATKEDPLAVYLSGSLPAGGLGKHSQDELSSVLAGRSVRFSFGAGTDAFVMTSGTTPRDLELQMQVMAATITDPGYRREGVERFRQNIDNYFETLRSTPSRALGTAQARELSDGDPRFTLQPKAAFEALDFAGLEAAISDRLAKGAIEVGVVGDVDEQAVIDAVATTLGALPPREADFLPREEARQRTFTADRSRRTLTHEGEADQALIRFVWPATDDNDFIEAVEFQMLARVLKLELTDRIREELGQAYSPRAGVSLSHFYRDYGTITITVSVDVEQVDATRAAILDMIEDLQGDAITPDVLERARKPLLERHTNTLKSLGGWMRLTERAASEADRIVRYEGYPEAIEAVTVEQLRARAAEFVRADEAVEFVVVPETPATDE
ncbi:MAG: insulinase family protein [Pseudomonadota bacterium]